MEGGPEESLYGPLEAPDFERAALQPIDGAEAENRIGGREEEGNMPVLPSGQNMNPTAEYMAILRYIGITIDEDNDTAPENPPTQQQQQQGQEQQDSESWKSEGIISP